MKFTFLTTSHIVNILLSISSTATSEEAGEIKAFTFGLLLILFSPIIFTFLLVDVLLSFVCCYVIPIVSIILMCIVGFPILKVLQWVFLSSEYLLSAGYETKTAYRNVFVNMARTSTGFCRNISERTFKKIHKSLTTDKEKIPNSRCDSPSEAECSTAVSDISEQHFTLQRLYEKFA